MANFPAYFNLNTQAAPATPAAYVAPDFAAGKFYTCTGRIADSKTSKSFIPGTSYLCVKDYDALFLVTETAGIVPVGSLKSTFVDFDPTAA